MSHVGSDQVPTGEVDAHLGWTQNSLVVSFEVVDSERVEGPTGRLYRGDSIELFLAEEVGSDDLFQIIASPGISGGEFESVRFATYLNGQEKRFDPAPHVIGEVTETGYWIQMRIPWSAVGWEDGRPEHLAMHFFVNDRDVPIPEIGDAYLRYMDIDHLGWFPDRTTVQDHTRMHRLTLADKVPIRDQLVNVAIIPGEDSSELVLYLPEQYAGQTLRIVQGSRELADTQLDPYERELSIGRVSLPNRELLGDESLQLTVADQPVGEVQLYHKPGLEERLLLRRVLETGEESDRWLAMVTLQGQTDDELLRQDLSLLEPLVNLWVNGRELAMSGRVVNPNQYLMFHVNPVSPPELRRDSPLYPIFCLYRARNIIWRGIQGGEEQQRLKDYRYARTLLEQARKQMPANPPIGMYLDEPIPWPSLPPHPDAPEWANDQRACIAKIREITEFWIDHRLMPNGSYGGDWNDDVEMWRNWWPIMFAFEDLKSVEAQRKLTTAIFEQPHMQAGYSAVMDNVEHSAEDSADTLTPMLFLEPDNPQWRDKAINIAQIMRDVWTGENEQGNLAFKSIVMNATGVSGGPHNAYDTTLDFRAVQPTLVYWQQTRDPSLTPQLTRWFDTWVQAAASTDNGKPAGILPSSIHWPSGRPGGPNHWWLTEGFSLLYDWPQYVEDALTALLVGYEVTGEAKYLEPLIAMATMRRAFLRDHPDAKLDDFESGTEAWAAAQIGSLLTGALMSYRMLSGDTQFDELLKADGNSYVNYLITGDFAPVAETLEANRATLGFNREVYATEVRWTDRVYRFVKSYYSYFSDELTVPDTRFIHSTLTGDTTTWVGSRLPAVRWLTPAEDFAAVVNQFDTDSFSAEVFHFGRESRDMAARFPLLHEGSYQLTLISDDDSELMRHVFRVTPERREVAFQVPPGKLTRIVVIRQ